MWYTPATSPIGKFIFKQREANSTDAYPSYVAADILLFYPRPRLGNFFPRTHAPHLQSDPATVAKNEGKLRTYSVQSNEP